MDNHPIVKDDPSDWPEDFKELRILDNLLRCSICFEYFNIAVLATRCCHNYCSFCARKYITYKSQCPSCPAEMHSSELKCNRVLDEIVRAFVSVRPRLLRMIRENTEIIKNNQIKDKQNEMKKAAKTISQAKVARENIEPDLSDNDFATIQVKKRKDLNQSGDFLSGSSTSTLTSSDVDSASEHGGILLRRTICKNKAACPVCGKEISVTRMNLHLDTCLTDRSSRRNLRACSLQPAAKRIKIRSNATNNTCTKAPLDEEEKRLKNDDNNREHEDSLKHDSCENKPDLITEESPARIPRTASNQLLPADTGEKRKRLPELILSGLTDKRIRAKLKEYGLSTKGDKKTIQNRLKNYILLYNSQCDAVKPMPVADIIKEVEQAELVKNRLASKGSTVIHTFDRSKSNEEKAQFSENYLAKHKDHFEKLIQDVRNRRKRNLDTSKLPQSQGPKNDMDNNPGFSICSTDTSSCFVEADNKEQTSLDEPTSISDEVQIDNALPGSPTKPILIDIDTAKFTANSPNREDNEEEKIHRLYASPRLMNSDSKPSSRTHSKLTTKPAINTTKKQPNCSSSRTSCSSGRRNSKLKESRNEKQKKIKGSKSKTGNITLFFQKNKTENATTFYEESRSDHNSEKGTELGLESMCVSGISCNDDVRSSDNDVNKCEMAFNTPSPSEMDLFDEYNDAM